MVLIIMLLESDYILLYQLIWKLKKSTKKNTIDHFLNYIVLGMIWGFQGLKLYNVLFLGYYAMLGYLLHDPTFRTN